MIHKDNDRLVKNPHDLFLKAILNENGPLTAILSLVIPNDIIQYINANSFHIDTNDYLGPKLRTSFSDVVVTAEMNIAGAENPRKSVSFSFIFEHKSYEDEDAIFQLCHYCLSFWEKQLGQQNQLNLLLPILVTHNNSCAGYKTQILDYFALLPSGLMEMVTPSFKLIHLNLNDPKLYSKERPHLYALYFLARCRNVPSIQGFLELFHLMHFDDPELHWSPHFMTQCIS